MSDLRLTDEQVEELPTLGPLGEEAAYELGLWRMAWPAPWMEDKNIRAMGPDVNTHALGSDYPGCFSSFKVIIHARNTAKLRAALVYWVEKKRLNKEWSGWWDLAHIDRKLEAIAAALKEMRP